MLRCPTSSDSVLTDGVWAIAVLDSRLSCTMRAACWATGHPRQRCCLAKAQNWGEGGGQAQTDNALARFPHNSYSSQPLVVDLLKAFTSSSMFSLEVRQHNCRQIASQLLWCFIAPHSSSANQRWYGRAPYCLKKINTSFWLQLNTIPLPLLLCHSTGNV